VRLTHLIPTLLALSLSACVETTAATIAPTSSPDDSARVGPGPRPVSASLAVETFRAACLDTSPTAAPAILRARGFLQNTQTGTFYSQSDNLSVKLIPESGGGRCSIVFGSTEGPQRVVAAGAPSIRFEPSSEIDGQIYYRAFIGAGQ
jgi:hypothetical protein